MWTDIESLSFINCSRYIISAFIFIDNLVYLYEEDEKYHCKTYKQQKRFKNYIRCNYFTYTKLPIISLAEQWTIRQSIYIEMIGTLLNLEILSKNPVHFIYTFNILHKWEDNIRMNLEEIGINAGNWVDLAQDRNYWRALGNAALNLRVS